jgi:hypothetical protein
MHRSTQFLKERTERKDHLKGKGVDSKIAANFPLRLTKQDDIKMHEEWRYSSKRSLSRQKGGGWSTLRFSLINPGEITPVCIGEEVLWAPEPI